MTASRCQLSSDFSLFHTATVPLRILQAGEERVSLCVRACVQKKHNWMKSDVAADAWTCLGRHCRYQPSVVSTCHPSRRSFLFWRSFSSGFEPSNRMIIGSALLLRRCCSARRLSGASLLGPPWRRYPKQILHRKVKAIFWLLSKNKVLHRDGNAIKIQLVFFLLWERLSLQAELRLSVRPSIHRPRRFLHALSRSSSVVRTVHVTVCVCMHLSVRSLSLSLADRCSAAGGLFIPLRFFSFSYKNNDDSFYIRCINCQVVSFLYCNPRVPQMYTARLLVVSSPVSLALPCSWLPPAGIFLLANAYLHPATP